MRRYLHLLAIGAFLPALCMAGESDGYYYSRIDHQNGLSHSAVLSTFQDRDGLMWFGTYDGLNCYDGRDMTVFRSDFRKDPTLSSNVVYAVCQADGNSLWVDTQLGLDKFSLDLMEVTSVYGFHGEYSVHSNSAGDTWAVSADTLWYFNTRYQDFCPLDIGLEKWVPAGDRTFVDENGSLWNFPVGSGTADIFSVRDFSSDTSKVQCSVFRYDFHYLPVEQLFCQNGMICFTDSRKDLYLYDIQKQSKIFACNIAELVSRYGKISGILPFFDDIIIGFHFSGLVRLNASGRGDVEELDRNLRIYGLYKDSRQGILWVSTDGAGAVMYARKNAIAGNLMLASLSDNLTRQVRSIVADSSGGGIYG